ncbi:MAG TPA: hypothetical protein IGR64_14985 [Leptolyngbyaceae cyanobacterium M65_K2018_010]|nr:hypothetical protein [Leptolyngbyaceae cyanobacterium M65_K2018_010]
MSDKEALIVLKQRAEMKWSDPKVVFHFIEHLCHYSPRPERLQACSLAGVEQPPEVPTFHGLNTLEQPF